MIICYLSHFPYNYETEFDKVYFLSRAYDDSNNALSSNDVFVYNQDSDGRNTFLVNMFTNVRLAFYEFWNSKLLFNRLMCSFALEALCVLNGERIVLKISVVYQL